MKNGGGHFAPELGGHFELESGGHFKLELGGQYHWNLHEDRMKAEIEANYKQIKQDIIGIVSDELERIKNDPDLKHLVTKADDKKSNTPK
jgi:hypothetical protein